jgi:hypothetical protein
MSIERDDDELPDEDKVPCPACGNSTTLSRECTYSGCQDGFEDLYEDDPINESPGTYITCVNCSGTSIERWCPKCGRDYWRAKKEAKVSR